jgi:subtilisin family serine protease
VNALLALTVACAPLPGGPEASGPRAGKADGARSAAFRLLAVPPSYLDRDEVEVVSSLEELEAARRSLYLADARDDGVGSSRAALGPAAVFLYPVAQSAVSGLIVALGFTAAATAVAPEVAESIAELDVDLPDAEVPAWATPRTLRLLAAAARSGYERLAPEGDAVLSSVDRYARAHDLTFVESDRPASREVEPDGTVTSEYMVMLGPEATRDEARALGEAYGIEIDAFWSELGAGFSTTQTARAAALELSRDAQVLMVEENARYLGAAASGEAARSDARAEAEADERDCDGSVPWNLDRIDQRDLPLDCRYEPIGRGTGVDVYVLDTGVAEDHPELDPRVDAGYDAVSGREERAREDCHGHGTEVASLVAGWTLGVASGAIVVPVRVMDCQGQYTTADVRRALAWVRASHLRNGGPSVVNFSARETLPVSESQQLSLAVQSLVTAGVPFVTAAGNDGRAADAVAPARFPAAITVGSTGIEDERAPDSNFGARVDLHAPGRGVLAAHPAGHVTVVDGTSFAAPHVAGAAAIQLGLRGGAAPEAVRQALVTSATEGRVKALPDATPNRLLYVGAEAL